MKMKLQTLGLGFTRVLSLTGSVDGVGPHRAAISILGWSCFVPVFTSPPLKMFSLPRVKTNASMDAKMHRNNIKSKGNELIK